MASVGFPELVLLFVIGLLILGPERLPRVATQIGRWVGKARRTANQLRYQMEREIALAEIDRTQSKQKRDKPKEESGAGGDVDRSGTGTADADSTNESDGEQSTASAPGDETVAAASSDHAEPDDDSRK